MRKNDVIKYFGTGKKAAEAIGVTKGAISLWDEVIPELRARQFHEVTRGKLKFDRKDYEQRASA